MLDWLLREGWIVLSWWALVTLAGAAALPLCVRLLGALPDKGYTLARAAGLLLVGFVFWLLASFGFLRNTPGDMLLSWLLVVGISVAVYVRAGTPFDWKEWWRENRPVVIAGELLFLVLLVGWAAVRAHQNGLTGTEKPMELMFMSAVQRSDTFPPNDGWMSGYAISYYYFGYVISSMLAMLSGVPSTTGFNMTIALLFALTGTAAFGVVYNLVRSRALHRRDENRTADAPSRSIAMVVGVLGTVLVVLMGNFQLPLVEIPYQTGTASADYLQFWNMDERQTPQPAEMSEPDIDPANWGHWWWFRASRALNDLDTNNGHIEVIDEFPQFSFLLADTHPHVLALPCVMLALAMALNLLLTGRDPTRGEILFYGLCVGGLAFLNTWDGPVYLLVMVGADAVRRIMRNASGRLTGGDWLGLLSLGGKLLGLTVLLFLPFWFGFRSQAGGVLPNIINPTTTPQLFLMFGPFLLLLAPFLAVEAWRARERFNLTLGLGTAVGMLVALAVGLAVMAAAASLVPTLRQDALRWIEEAGGWNVVLPMVFNRRLAALLTTLILLAGIALVVGRLFPRHTRRRLHDDSDAAVERVVAYPAATGFALVLIGAALVLVLVPEFIYLRDNFSTRMNTIFKFYYQAWLLFSIGTAYGIYSILADARLRLPALGVRGLYGALTAVVLMAGLLYPVLGIYTRMFIENGRMFALTPAPLTLDGGTSFVVPDDYAAIMCLNDIVQGDEYVVAEAIGPAYHSEYGRVAALTGIPILLGWEGHEGQWRGATYRDIVGSSPGDIPLLYQDPRWDVAQEIITRYGIDYIFYGQSERNRYGAGGEEKFRDNLDIVCESGSSRFYRVNPQIVAVK